MLLDCAFVRAIIALITRMASPSVPGRGRWQLERVGAPHQQLVSALGREPAKGELTRYFVRYMAQATRVTRAYVAHAFVRRLHARIQVDRRTDSCTPQVSFNHPPRKNLVLKTRTRPVTNFLIGQRSMSTSPPETLSRDLRWVEQRPPTTFSHLIFPLPFSSFVLLCRSPTPSSGEMM